MMMAPLFFLWRLEGTLKMTGLTCVGNLEAEQMRIADGVEQYDLYIDGRIR
jgi:hypothetical protein